MTPDLPKYADSLADRDREIADLKAEIERLRAVLKYYADDGAHTGAVARRKMAACVVSLAMSDIGNDAPDGDQNNALKYLATRPLPPRLREDAAPSTPQPKNIYRPAGRCRALSRTLRTTRACGSAAPFDAAMRLVRVRNASTSSCTAS